VFLCSIFGLFSGTKIGKQPTTSGCTQFDKKNIGTFFAKIAGKNTISEFWNIIQTKKFNSYALYFLYQSNSPDCM